MRIENIKSFSEALVAPERLRVLSVNEVLKKIGRLPVSYSAGRAVVDIEDLLSTLIPNTKNEQLTLW